MKIYNSMTRREEEFVPIHEGKVNIYACVVLRLATIHIVKCQTVRSIDTLRRFKYIGEAAHETNQDSRLCLVVTVG